MQTMMTMQTMQAMQTMTTITTITLWLIKLSEITKLDCLEKICDVDVFVTLMLSFVTIFHEDEHLKLIEEDVDVWASSWSQSFVVSFTNSYVNEDHVSSFTWFLICLNLFLRVEIAFDSSSNLRRLISLMNSMQWASWRWNFIFRTNR